MVEAAELTAILDASARPKLQTVFVRDANIISLTSHEFFAQVVPAMLTICAVFTVFLLLTWVWVRLWMFLLWKCGFPTHWVRLTAYLWAVLMIFAAFWLAFAAVGIDFSHLFLGVGLFTLAFSAGCTGVLSNFFAGMRLQTHGLYVNHERIRIRELDNLTGSIESMNLLHIMIKPEPSAEAKGDQFRAHSVMLPNTALTDNTVEIMWSSGKTPVFEEKPSRAMQYAMTKRMPDLESGPAEPSHAQEPGTVQNIGLLAKQKLELQRRQRKSALSSIAELQQEKNGDKWSFHE